MFFIVIFSSRLSYLFFECMQLLEHCNFPHCGIIKQILFYFILFYSPMKASRKQAGKASGERRPPPSIM